MNPRKDLGEKWSKGINQPNRVTERQVDAGGFPGVRPFRRKSESTVMGAIGNPTIDHHWMIVAFVVSQSSPSCWIDPDILNAKSIGMYAKPIGDMAYIGLSFFASVVAFAVAFAFVFVVISQFHSCSKPVCSPVSVSAFAFASMVDAVSRGGYSCTVAAAVVTMALSGSCHCTNQSHY